MCVRLALALLLVASCGSCSADRDQVVNVSPYRPVGIARGWPEIDSDGGPYVVLRDACPNACTYTVPSPEPTPNVSVAALAAHIKNFCLTATTDCSVSVSGTPATILELSAACDCLTVVIERSGTSGKSTATATLWAGRPLDIKTTLFTTSFTVGP